jgi:hypothetical protein
MSDKTPLAGGVFTAMNNELFRGARLKIERANKHIRDLGQLTNGLNQIRSHAIRVETNPDTGYDSLQFLPAKPIPGEFMCIVGDALHNLRTALDFVANDIEFANTGKRSNNTKFPVRDTRDELVTAMNGGFIHKAPKEIVDFIVDVIQPYETGDGKSIWALHALDIEDKHRLLIPHLQFQWVRHIRYKDETGTEFEFPEWAATGEHIPKFSTGRKKVEVTDQGHATIGIVFAHGLPLSGKHIVPTLRNLAVFLYRTIDSIERRFFGP